MRWGSKIRDLYRGDPKPSLSICIPSYNRAPYLYVRLRSLRVLMARICTDQVEVEIVVSDNWSQDDTAQICDAMASEDDRVRLVRPPQHLPTAEENLHFALGQCHGEYVWILGDDDDPLPVAVERLVAYVMARRVDIVVFNSGSHSWDGFHLGYSRIPCATSEWSGSLLEFVRRTGFWFVLAGFSTLLLRRPQDRLAAFRRALDTSKIYSHVAWIVGEYHDTSFKFCNVALVSYRQNYTDVVATDHWPNVARREGTFTRGLWTNGFLRLFEPLMAAGVIERDFLATVIDRNIERKFRLADEILHHFLEQLAYIQVHNDAFFTSAEMDYFVDWAQDLFDDSSAIVHHLLVGADEYRNKGRIPPHVLEKLWALLQDRKSRPWYSAFHLETLGAYDLFRHGTQYWAMRADIGAAHHYTVDQLEVVQAPPYVICATSLTELQRQIEASPLGIAREVASEDLAWLAAPAPPYHVDVFSALLERNGMSIVPTAELQRLRDQEGRAPGIGSAGSPLMEDPLGIVSGYERCLTGASRAWLSRLIDRVRDRLSTLSVPASELPDGSSARRYRCVATGFDAEATGRIDIARIVLRAASLVARCGTLEVGILPADGSSDETLRTLAEDIRTSFIVAGLYPVAISRNQGGVKAIGRKVTELRGIYENLEDSAFVHAMYCDLLGREADAGGFHNYLDELRNGRTREEIELIFLTSDERFGRVAMLYRHLWPEGENPFK